MDEQLEELQHKYIKALNNIAALEKKLKKLEKENQQLKRQNKILMRAIEIASQMPNTNLKAVLEEIARGDLHESDNV